MSAEQLTHNQECVTQQLHRLGYDVEVKDDEYFELDASYADIESVLHAPAIGGIALECAGTDCESCYALSEEECSADAFCVPINGRRRSPEAACYDIQFPGCMPGNIGCGDLVTYAHSPDNACWMFHNTCLPHDFVETELCYEQFDEAEECGAP